ncbi:putative protein with four repeated domains in the Fasciclin I family of proteins, present in many other contexts [Lyophyllum shimeji]|uniref:FAS1 domain-containing protein n=1 Tax=Lyophyllum shimeji TaxID=47721 RepID=A0A9P3UQ55_LYOSH|nr:putative protein with four repeated domains in the Fasciclin I family of proteins, present in many other contexts [Lyophyllum shimeji]
MRSLLIPLAILGLSSHAQAQALNSTGLMSALQAAGLTALATALQRANETKAGQDLIGELLNGSSNHTVFAPNNAAFDAPGVSAIANNPAEIANILSYHVVPGNFVNIADGNSTLISATFPSVTVARTSLTNSTLVNLEGNKPQVVAWTRNDTSNSKVYFLNQSPEVTVLSTTAVGNLLIATISGVLIPPPDIEKVLAANNLMSLNGIVSNVPVPSFYSNGTNATVEQALEANKTRGFTFFCPNDAAIKDAESALTGLTNNQTALVTLLANHYVNGTASYSPELTSSTSELVSAAGQSFSFISNSSGTYVASSNGASAKIVKTDALVENGVIHIVDHVLVNLNRDDAKASSAYSSATAAAAKSATQTGPISPTSTSSSGGKPGGGKGSGNSALAVSVASAGGAMLVGAVGWILFMGVVVG